MRSSWESLLPRSSLWPSKLLRSASGPIAVSRATGIASNTKEDRHELPAPKRRPVRRQRPPRGGSRLGPSTRVGKRCRPTPSRGKPSIGVRCLAASDASDPRRAAKHLRALDGGVLPQHLGATSLPAVSGGCVASSRCQQFRPRGGGCRRVGSVRERSTRLCHPSDRVGDPDERRRSRRSTRRRCARVPSG